MDNRFKKLLIPLIGAGILIAGIAYASVLQGFQGGTGFGPTTTSTNAGYCLTVASTTPFLTYNFNPCGSGSSSTVSLTGSSTAFYFPYWLDANGSLSSSSLIFQTSTRIGINNTSPSVLFQIGTSTYSGVGAGETTRISKATNPYLAVSANGKELILGYDTTDNFADINAYDYGGSNQLDIAVGPVASPIAMFKGTGSLGIGTTAPSVALDVNGDIRDRNVTSSAYIGTNASGTIIRATTPLLSYNVSSANTYIGVSTTTTSATLTFSTSSFGTNAFTSGGLPSIATTTKSIYDAAPSSTDDYVMFYTESAFTLKQVDCINGNIAGNTATFNITWGSNRNSTTSNAFTSNTACTATTTIQTPSINGSTTIPAGSIIRLVLSAASSTGIYVDFKY